MSCPDFGIHVVAAAGPAVGGGEIVEAGAAERLVLLGSRARELMLSTHVPKKLCAASFVMRPEEI
jgi:hypothetical protein